MDTAVEADDVAAAGATPPGAGGEGSPLEGSSEDLAQLGQQQQRGGERSCALCLFLARFLAVLRGVGAVASVFLLRGGSRRMFGMPPSPQNRPAQKRNRKTKQTKRNTTTARGAMRRTPSAESYSSLTLAIKAMTRFGVGASRADLAEMGRSESTQRLYHGAPHCCCHCCVLCCVVLCCVVLCCVVLCCVVLCCVVLCGGCVVHLYLCCLIVAVL